MKRILGWIILAMAITGCQKAPESTRIGGPGAMTPGQVTSTYGLQFNGVLYDQYASIGDFTNRAQDFMEWTIDRSYVGTVSPQGGDSGIFVGGKLELANGQPVFVNNGNVQIAPNSQLAVYVKDSFPGVNDLAPLPVRLFTSANGYVTGNTLHVVFNDEHGSVTLDGSFDQPSPTSVAHLQFSFVNQTNSQGAQGRSGNLGVLYVPTCSFLRCH